MFTDIKGYTARTSSSSRSELLKMLEEHDRLVRPVFEECGGTVVKTIGDAFLVTFESPTDAVLCGMRVQEVLAKHNEEAHPEEHFKIRVAINSGEVTVKDNDVFGEPVNIAARIEGIAEPNEVYFTEAVYLAMNKSEVPSAEVGHRHLKGIPNEIKVYKVLKEKDEVKAGKAMKKARRADGLSPKKFPWKFWLIAALVIVGFLAVAQNPKTNNFDEYLLVLVLFVYAGASIQELAKDAKTENVWLSWVPIIQFFYCISIVKKPGFWYLLYLVPGVNLVFLALTWMELAKFRNVNKWAGLLILVPGVQILLPGYLAFVAKR